MKITYGITGEQRKALVAAISQELNAPTQYLGAPTFAYEVGSCRIDREGTLTGKDSRELVDILKNTHGFIPASVEYDAPVPEPKEIPSADASEAAQADEMDRLVVDIPLTGFSPEKLDNLFKLVNAKAPLLKAALDTDDLAIQQVEDKLRFPWFHGRLTIDAVLAYTLFISRLCEAAREKKRVTAKERTPENLKYAMRCWLLSLGFIGDEYKTARKILISKLEGSSSYKSGHRTSGKGDV